MLAFACIVAAALLAQPVSSKRPLIYIYDLPEEFSSKAYKHEEMNTGMALVSAIRSTGHEARTSHLADFYLIPVFPMGDELLYDELLLAIDYVVAHRPFWNATKGYNHLVVGAWDFGLARIAGSPAFERIIQLSHFGWTNASTWQTTVDGRCRFRHGDRCVVLTDHLGPLWGTYRPGVDILLPDIKEKRDKELAKKDTNRTNLVFFAGSATNIWREEVYKLYPDVPGWRIVQGHVNLAEEVQSAVFCLDLGGAGYSTRFALSVVLGCIPVYLNELKQQWDGVLPLDDFSVPFTPAQLPDLRAVVEGISKRKRDTLALNLLKYKKYYHWATLYGPAGESTVAESFPDAFELLMTQLRERAARF